MKCCISWCDAAATHYLNLRRDAVCDLHAANPDAGLHVCPGCHSDLFTVVFTERSWHCTACGTLSPRRPVLGLVSDGPLSSAGDRQRADRADHGPPPSLRLLPGGAA